MLKKIIIFFVIVFILGINVVFSYDNLITHPHLSRVAVQVYNNSADDFKINKEQAGWIEYGAINEDTDPRYLNHFYDPKTGQGLHEMPWFGVSAKKWAQSQNSATGDYDYQTILDNYRDDNKKRAWQGVGHILHLIQDMSVPAHTRNDGHMTGDPYEAWAERFGRVEANGINKVNISSLDQAFDALATYTSDNFFSKDTVDIDRVNKYSVKRKIFAGIEKEYAVGLLDDIEYEIIEVDRTGLLPIYKINNYNVNQSYWNLLAPKAVAYSAGVIELFVNEFKKIDEQKAAERAKMSWLDKVGAGLKDLATPLLTLDDLAYNWGDTFMALRPVVAGEAEAMMTAAKLTGTAAKLGGELVVDTSKDIGNQALETGNVVGAKLAIAGGEVKGAFVSALETKAPVKIISMTVADLHKKEAGSSPGVLREVKVLRVLDGDTIELTSGEKVRYIGIDAPELNQSGATDDECLAWVAKVRNEQLLQRGKVRILSDAGADKDVYGRLLRYVYAGDTFVNGQLSKEGLGKTFFCQAGWKNCPLMTDSVRKQIILEAGAMAMSAKHGLFSGVCDIPKIEKITKVTPTNPELEKEQNQAQPEVQNPQTQSPPVQKGIDILIFSNSRPLVDNVIVLDNGLDDDEDLEGVLAVATSSASTTETVATSTDDEDDDEETNDDDTPTEYLDLSDVELILFDRETGNEIFTSSTTVGIRLEGFSDPAEYYLAQNDDDPDPEAVWLTTFPEQLTLFDEDGFAENDFVDVYLWIRQAGYLPDNIDNGIIVDREKPEITFVNTSADEASSSDATFNINCDDNSQWYFVDEEETAVTWNYKLDEDEWLMGTNDEDIVFSGLNDGLHTIQIEALDHALNMSTSSFSWTISLPVTEADLLGGHLVISEIKVGSNGNSNDEFVEIYNPGNSDVDLSNYRLAKKTATGREYDLVSSFQSFADKTAYSHSYYIISPNEHIILNNNNNSYIVANATYTATGTSNILSHSNTVVLYNETGGVVDKVGYGTVSDFEGQPFTDISDGKSIERKYIASSTYETMKNGGFEYLKGNGYDTDNNANDFILRQLPDPQNYYSDSEPAFYILP